MDKIIHNKLVRDYIPNILGYKKLHFKYHIIENNEEYLKELNKKLIEEANEYINNSDDITELADIMEVIEAILEAKNWSKNKLKRSKNIKLKERGGFRNKIFLESVN